MSLRKRFAFTNDDIRARLADLRTDIDDLGELAMAITGDAHADELACYASNTLEGATSLLRELGRLVKDAPKGRRRKR